MRQKPGLDFEEAVCDNFAQDLDYLELPLSRKTFILIAVFAGIIGFVVIFRLGFLNIFKTDFYKNRAAANVNREVVVPAFRGVISDRFGEILAENLPSFSVFINAAEFSKREDLSILDKLSEILAIDKEELISKIKAADLEQQNLIQISRNVSPEQIIALKTLNLSSVTIEEDYRRLYKDGPIFAHLLGYDGQVKTGLEAVYDNWLKGQDGISLIFEDVKGRIIDKKILKNSVSGDQLTLSIDAGLQRYFYFRLNDALRVLGRTSGVGIAMNTQNGEILALISLPSFDNNLFVESGANQEKQRLLNSSLKPLFNRAISGLYNPGSTIKPFLALAALKENIIKPDFQIFSRGYIEVPNPYNPEKPSRFLDWKPHGWVDLHSALARSSNIYFYAIGGGLPRSESDLLQDGRIFGGLGIERFSQYWKKLLFDRKTGIDLTAENFGFLFSPEEKEQRTGQIWRLGDTYNVSIGQGDMALTPLQLINFISSLANAGKIYRPHLVKDSSPEILVDYSDWQPEIKEIQKGLQDAVSEWYGTANLLSALPMPVAGKTGSAQIENNTKTNAFFVGYAPVDPPAGGSQIAVLVLIENAREGSLNAVPVAKDVLEWYYYNRL